MHVYLAGLFGDTMNTASRMETTATTGCIHMSSDTYELLQAVGEHWDLACTGGVEVKGKGKMVGACPQGVC